MGGTEVLSARNLARYGLRRGAYDGANRRRFVLFTAMGDGIERRSEFDTKRERDQFALGTLDARQRATSWRPASNGTGPRHWYVVRQQDGQQEVASDLRGRYRRFGSRETAQRFADGANR